MYNFCGKHQLLYSYFTPKASGFQKDYNRTFYIATLTPKI